MISFNVLADRLPVCLGQNTRCSPFVSDSASKDHRTAGARRRAPVGLGAKARILGQLRVLLSLPKIRQGGTDGALRAGANGILIEPLAFDPQLSVEVSDVIPPLLHAALTTNADDGDRGRLRPARCKIGLCLRTQVGVVSHSLPIDTRPCKGFCLGGSLEGFFRLSVRDTAGE